MRIPPFAALLLGLGAASTSAAQPAPPRAPQPAPVGPVAHAAANPPASLDSVARGHYARYVGQYTLADSAGGPDTPLRVFEQGGGLSGQLRANAPTRLVPSGPDAFHPDAAPEFTLTFAVERGRAVAVTVRGPGVRLRGPRDARPAAAPTVTPAAAETPTGGALYAAVARLDSLLFDASYVRCDTAAVEALLADDVEFYHDLTGFHAGHQVRDDFRRLAANCPRAQGIARVLVPGSLRVYPIRDYGAVEAGEHRFVRRDGAPGGGARFVHLWRQQPDGRWRLARVLSFDHRPEAPEAASPAPASPAPAGAGPSGP
ncbi:hypothetical protein tb265_04780 [Gemmatimonadetes bacterium T265]|nr:hypothetical protein tb265_04780 [Gemmatimonadetes bacterium T265]